MSTKEIQNAAIFGMGALGLLFGEMIAENIGREHVIFLMDAERLARHEKDVYTINETTRSFQMADCAKAEPYDLVFVAVKSPALPDVIRQMAPAVGADTVIVSLMNGITSEEVLAERYDRAHIIDCVSIGMDAMRDGTDLRFTQTGKLQVGVTAEEQEESFRKLTDFLRRARIPFEESSDIRRDLWSKLMLNVGINQACTAHETDYEHAVAPGPIFEELKGAMREVIALANREHVNLTEEDMERAVEIWGTLKPDGYPSMRQDALAHRKTELDLFAGTIIELGRKHGVPTPVNETYYEMIRRIESKYEDAPANR